MFVDLKDCELDIKFELNMFVFEFFFLVCQVCYFVMFLELFLSELVGCRIDDFSFLLLGGGVFDNGVLCG